MEPSSKSAEATLAATVRDDRGGKRSEGRAESTSERSGGRDPAEEELRLVEQHRVNLLLMGQHDIVQPMVDALSAREYPVLQGIFLLLAVSVVLANLIADLVYGLLDPRVRT